MNPLIGKLIAGKYRVESIVGSGGIGTVYRAIQEPLDRPVAIKMLRPEFSENSNLRRRFAREARAVAALSHPNIAMVHDFGVDRDRSLFMAMEFVDGRSFAEVIEDPQITLAQLLPLFEQILTGLAHAHARGIIHRDIKPGNILVAQQEDAGPLVKIVDFGIAAITGFNWEDDADATGAGQVVGTPQYMAPEQARGERHITATVDIYAVGLMLYRAITGHDAFSGENPMDILVAQVTKPPPPLVPRPGMVLPEGLEPLLERSLAKSPLHRIPSANSFRSQLRQLMGVSSPIALHRPVFSTDSELNRERLHAAEQAPTVDVAIPTFEGTNVDFPGVGSHLERSFPVGSALRGETPFVGREDELGELVNILVDYTARNSGLIVLMDGAAGMGKTRFAGALREHLSEHASFRTGYGSYHREGERGLRGIREAVDDLLGFRGLNSEDMGERIAQRLNDLGGFNPADAQLLTSFLRPSSVAPVNQQLFASTRPDALFDVIFRLLVASATLAPTALFIDDLQWSGVESHAFIEFVATELQHQPARIVLAVTLQSDRSDPADTETVFRTLARFDGGTVHRHHLAPLTESGARRLLGTLLQASEPLANALVTRAAGNAMHLVQLVRYVVDEGLLETGPEGWQARPGVDVRRILPPSLADVMAVRLDQLEQLVPGGRLRDLLNRCAILGRSFRFSVLERMLQIENRSDLLETIDADVDLLLDEEYLRMRPTRNDDILAFPSSLIRDTLLEQLANRRTTRRLHANAAEAKLALLGDSLDEIAEDLMRHYGEARDVQRELEFGQRAASVAEQNHRPNDAVSHLKRVLDLLEDTAQEEAPVVVDLHLRLGNLLTGLAAYREASEHFSFVSAQPLASPQAQTAAMLGQANIHFIQGELQEAQDLFRRALDAEYAGSDPEVRIIGTLGLAKVAMLGGDLDLASTLASEALEIARETQVARQIPEAVWLIADIARSRGELDIAFGAFEEARSLFDKDDNPSGVARCLAKMAVTERGRANYSAAVSHYERAREAYGALGDRKEVAHQLNGLGDIARFTGDFGQASDLYRRAVDIFHSLELPYDAAIALTNLGLVAMESGRDIDAEAAFRRAAEVTERLGAAYLAIGIGLNLAFVLARMGMEDESQNTLKESLALADVSDLVDPDYARPLERMAEILAGSGDRAGAGEILDRARSMWEELGRPEDIQRVSERMEQLR